MCERACPTVYPCVTVSAGHTLLLPGPSPRPALPPGAATSLLATFPNAGAKALDEGGEEPGPFPGLGPGGSSLRPLPLPSLLLVPSTVCPWVVCAVRRGCVPCSWAAISKRRTHYPLTIQCSAESVILFHLKLPQAGAGPICGPGCSVSLAITPPLGGRVVRASLSGCLPSPSCLFIILPGPSGTRFRE